MLIYVKNIIKKNKKFYGRTDGRTDGQPKTIVRNLTKDKNWSNKFKKKGAKIS
jgi:hypothetical protein